MLTKFLALIVTIFAFLLDRITKEYLPVTKFCNEGAAFGIFQGQTLFLSIFSAAILITLIIYTKMSNRNLSTGQKIALGLIMGGTAGNLFDRIGKGYVIDFINITFMNFPVFNFADVFINAGAVILLLVLLARK